MRYIRITPQRHSFFRRIRIGGSLAEFNSLEVGAKILYRDLVLRFGNVHPYDVKSSTFNWLGLRFYFRRRKIKSILPLPN